ncbi:hypothetical protein A2155_01010 [candidate division WWE3 bacterium RBG_16_52_45]|nr:MAG: hypothetical protein A2155_01010 [candidate division WWE3 bacterium RBG_16_52_45]
MGADRFCTLESPGYYSKVERYGSETNFYLSEEQTELFWMDTANFLSEKGLGPHALIAAAYILSDPEPFPETLSYPTAGGRVVITVSTVDKIEGWADLVSFTLAYFR